MKIHQPRIASIGLKNLPSTLSGQSAHEEAVADGFAGLSEQDYDEKDDKGLAQRNVNTSIKDTFAGLPEKDNNEQSV